MIIKCKECKIKFEGTSNALRCYDCRLQAAKDKSKEYQKTYRQKNDDKIKALAAKYHTDPAMDSGFF